MRTITRLVIVTLMLVNTTFMHAQSWNEIIKLTASDANTSDVFGFGHSGVSISGDKAIVGAYLNDDAGSSSGSAYIFELVGGTWIETQKITASDAAGGDRFGITVSISGDKAIVGADYNDDTGSNSGSAYIFELIGGTWTEIQKITASDAAADDRFGFSVSISGDKAIVGAYRNDDAGSNSGSAYIFEFAGGTWTETQKITASDANTVDVFGYSVSIAGDKAIVGAYFNDDTATDSGSAYIFELLGGTWTETQKITASDAAADDRFGRTVSISGDKAIVGAYYNNDAGLNSGSAYLFELLGGTWTETQKITASDANAGDNFGSSVSISANKAIIGAGRNDDAGSSSGSAYIFEIVGGTWTEIQKITASDANTGDSFGLSVSISGNCAIVGAHANDDAGSGSGSAYIFCDLVIILPIELTTFRGHPEGRANKLEWVTESELNNDYFSLLGSHDGQNFNLIATVPGAGNSSTPISYSEYDQTPLLGAYTYYQLEQTDFDGSTTRSNIIAIYRGALAIVNIYPNPADNMLHVVVGSPISGEVDVTVLNNLGQSVRTVSKQINDGYSTIVIDVSDLASGMYNFVVTTPEGEHVQACFIRK